MPRLWGVQGSGAVGERPPHLNLLDLGRVLLSDLACAWGGDFLTCLLLGILGAYTCGHHIAVCVPGSCSCCPLLWLCSEQRWYLPARGTAVASQGEPLFSRSLKLTGGPSLSPSTRLVPSCPRRTEQSCSHTVASSIPRGWLSWPEQMTTNKSKMLLTTTL